MRALLRNVIKQECDKHVERHFEYLTHLNQEIRRKRNRTGAPVSKTIRVRPWWSLSKHFHPFKVRTERALARYSYALAEKLKAKTYTPLPAVIRFTRKGDGSYRKLNIFSIPDAAVSRLVYKSLLKKNVSRMSSYAYAYREDRSPHDAIEAIHNEWRQMDRVFVAEYDFSRFFDEIDHSYVYRALERGNFLVSDREMHVINAFLGSSSSEAHNYPHGAEQRRKGIPQGTSVSLFLANAVCSELDRALERCGVGFARYADDTLIWSPSYDSVVGAYYLIQEHAAKMGVPINLLKSYGISLLTNVGKIPEMESKDSVEYLGYKLSLKQVSISEKGIEKIKARLSFLIYQNLLQPLKRGIFNRGRLLPGLDLDFYVAVLQVRFYLYGGVSDDRLRAFLAGRTQQLKFRGVMSYYPLVNDFVQLAQLDSWLERTFRQALRLRQSLFAGRGVAELPGPVPNWIEQLRELRTTPVGAGEIADIELPSFLRMNKAMRLEIARRGLGAVANPKGPYY